MNEYTTKAIADIVGISAQKLRYYAQTLEKAGYNVNRNHRGYRIFTDNDIPLFQELIKQSNNTEMNIEQIAFILVSNHNHSDPTVESHSEEDPLLESVAKKQDIPQNEAKTQDLQKSEVETQNIQQIDVDTKDLPQNDEERYKALLDEINSLKQLIANQQKYIDERLEQRDLKSLDVIRRSQEVKKADLELAASQEKEKKQGFFSWLFKM